MISFTGDVTLCDMMKGKNSHFSQIFHLFHNLSYSINMSHSHGRGFKTSLIQSLCLSESGIAYVEFDFNSSPATLESKDVEPFLW